MIKRIKPIFICALTFVLIFIVSACNRGRAQTIVPNNKSVQKNELVEESTNLKEPTQEELNAIMKDEAIKADFVKVNGGEVEIYTKLTLQGEVTSIMSDGVGGEFTLTTVEGNGYGMYTILNYSIEDVNKGDFVKVWGAYDGKANTGMPLIIATIIEKIDNDIENVDNESTDSGKNDFQLKAEANAQEYPAKPGAVLYNNANNNNFIGMGYYFVGEIIDFNTIENNVGDSSVWLVKNDEGYVMPVQHEFFEAKLGDVVEVWGTLSGNGYARIEGVDNVVGQTGSIHAMMVTVNGERQY